MSLRDRQHDDDDLKPEYIMNFQFADSAEQAREHFSYWVETVYDMRDRHMYKRSRPTSCR